MNCCAGLRLFVSSAPTRLLLDALDERAHDPHVDVGFEERDADLARDLVDVLLAEAPARSGAGEDAVETVGQGVEHEGRGYRGRTAPRTQSSKSAAANSSGSNSMRSPTPSPTPTTFTGSAELGLDREHDPALGRAVELGEHDAGHVDRVGELARLHEAVLPGRRRR